MTRNRAERRHHMVRLKKIRCRYRTAGDGSKKSIRYLLSYSLYLFLLDVWASTLS